MLRLAAICVTLVAVPAALGAMPTGAFADTHESAAKGTKNCYVTQMFSEHLEAMRADEVQRFGMSTVPHTTEVRFRISKGGGVYIGSVADTFPSSKLYVMIGNERFNGKADGWIKLSAKAVDALVAEKPFAYSYTNWPAGAAVDGEDAFTDFAAAKAECEAFLG